MKRPYLILAGLLAFVFLYLLSNNIAESYSAVLSEYSALQRRRESLIDPAELPLQRAELLAERDSLSKEVLNSRSKYRQSQVGVIQCVTDNARQSRVVIDSFSPGGEETSGQFNSISFTLNVTAPFMRLGKFISSLENASIPFGIREIQIVSNPIGESVLKAHIQATATLYHGFGKKEQ